MPGLRFGAALTQEGRQMVAAEVVPAGTGAVGSGAAEVVPAGTGAVGSGAD